MHFNPVTDGVLDRSRIRVCFVRRFSLQIQILEATAFERKVLFCQICTLFRSELEIVAIVTYITIKSLLQ